MPAGKASNNRDVHGDFAEALAGVLLATDGHHFRVKQIGGKWPTIDLYAELTDEQHPGVFCFFQIKSTTRGRDTNGRLKIGVSREAMNRLSGYYGPTYLIGVDLNSQQPHLSPAFVVAVQGSNLAGISSLPTTFPLTGATLSTLKDEVVRFWQSTNTQQEKRTFQSTLRP